MRVRYDVPYWLDRVPAARQPRWPRLREEIDADVAIVGGGLCGALAAYFCARQGNRVVLLEAGRVGQQSSGRSSGFVRGMPVVSFRQLQGRYGLKRARTMVDEMRRAALDLAALVRRLAIRSHLALGSAAVVAVDELDVLELRRELGALKAAGFESSWMPRAKVLNASGIDAPGAMRVDHDGHVDPYALTLGAVRAAVAAGAQVFEQTAVRRTRSGRRTALVTTAGTGAVRAPLVLMCTGAPSTLFPALVRHVRAFETYCVATPPLPQALLRQLGVWPSGRDSSAPVHEWRRTPDGRLLFQGAEQTAVPARLRPKVVVQRTGQLMYELSRLYPFISGLVPDYGWSCATETTADGILVAGRHRAFPQHAFAFGLGRGGPEAAYLGARILARVAAGAPDKADEAFGFPRLVR